MGGKSTYNISWDAVFDYLEDPGNSKKHLHFYEEVEPLIKHWLLRLGIRDNLNGHASSVFSDLFLKEQKRFKTGKLKAENCTAKITTYYFPAIKNLCIDYIDLLNSKVPLVYESRIPETEAIPGVFDELWGEHRDTVLKEMNRGIIDWIELSDFDPLKKEYLRKRYVQGMRFPEILNPDEKKEFETQRKWISRQGKKIAWKIANTLLPAIIDCYRLPIARKIDPKLVEKHLLAVRAKILL